MTDLIHSSTPPRPVCPDCGGKGYGVDLAAIFFGGPRTVPCRTCAPTPTTAIDLDDDHPVTVAWGRLRSAVVTIRDGTPDLTPSERVGRITQEVVRLLDDLEGENEATPDRAGVTP